MTNPFEKTLNLVDQLLASKQNIADTLVSKGEEASSSEPFDDLIQKAVDYVPRSYLFVDENGDESIGFIASRETVFDATPNDVRVGKTYGGSLGAETGEKVIPAYHTTEGYEVIKPGEDMKITFFDDKYEYTKLQIVLCTFNTRVSDSVAAIKIAINDKVYNVNSTDVISNIIIDNSTKSIDLSLINDCDTSVVLRYFTYKEII